MHMISVFGFFMSTGAAEGVSEGYNNKLNKVGKQMNKRNKKTTRGREAREDIPPKSCSIVISLYQGPA